MSNADVRRKIQGAVEEYDELLTLVGAFLIFHDS